MRTGIDWLDGPAAAVFVLVTLLSLFRLFPAQGHGSRLDFLDDAFHAVMGVAMVAMFWPGAGAARVWLALLSGAAVWLLLVFAQASRGVPSSSRPQARWPPARIGYYLTSAVIMIIALGASHGPLLGDAGRVSSMIGMSSTHTLNAELITDPSPIGTALSDAASWPVWPFVGIALLLYGGWLAFGGTGRGRSERVCGVLMAAGMALMAFSI